MTTPLQSFVTQVGIAKETTWGTGVAPSTADQFVPHLNFKPDDQIEEIRDDGLRGRAGLDQGVYQGFRIGKVSTDCHVYPDVIGNALMGIMGTDGWASGTTHPFSVLNTGLPPSYTWTDFYGVTGTKSRQYAGHYLDALTLTAAAGAMKAAISTTGKASPGSALVAKPTAVYTSAQPILTWQLALTLNSVLSTKLIAFDMAIKRPVEPILALGSQDPQAANVGQMEVTGKMTFAIGDDTELLLFATTGQAAFPASIVATSGANSLTLTMSKINFVKTTMLDRGTPYLKLAATFRATDNSTDGGPLAVTLVGGKSGAAY